MKRHGNITLLLVFMAVLCLFVLSSGDAPTLNEDVSLSLNEPDKGSTEYGSLNSSHRVIPSPVLQCRYYNEKDFMSSVASGSRIKGNANLTGDIGRTDKSIAGGIVPHHLLAGKMIAEFFRYISHNPPETIVIVAPNHRRTGMSGIHTSRLDWETPFGTLEADSGIAEKIIEKMNAAENALLMEEEHSISSLVPYIKYYMPETKIVPILLHGNYESSEKLGVLLADIQAENPGIAVIASVDFSHYLDAGTADKMDEKTLEAIKNQDIPGISKMGNDNLDSPPSIITLITAMKKAGTRPPEVLAHLNSSDITGTGADYTTGYYTIVYEYF